MLKKFLPKILLALSLLLPISAVAEVGGDLNLTNKAALVSRDGYDLILGTEGDDDFKIIQNQVVTFSIDGGTQLVTIPGALSVTGAITSSGTFAPLLPHNTYLKANNSTGVATDILKLDGSNLTILQSPNGIRFYIDADGQRQINFDASSDTALTMTFGDGGTTATQQLSIAASTVDNDDDAVLCLSGGGACAVAQGARLLLYGNENAANGTAYLQSGDDSGADLVFGSADDFTFETTSGTDIMELLETGHQVFTGSDIRYRGTNASARTMLFTTDSNAAASAYVSLYSDASNGGGMQLASGANAAADINLSAADDIIFETRAGADAFVIDTATGTFIGAGTATIGWSVVAGANTACTTTCTTPCVFGVNTAATEADIVACSDATADECLCAGAS